MTDDQKKSPLEQAASAARADKAEAGRKTGTDKASARSTARAAKNPSKGSDGDAGEDAGSARTAKAGSGKKKRRVFASDRRNLWLLVISTLLVIGSIFMFTPLSQKINEGLDIQGGLSVVLTANTTDGSDITSDDMQSSLSIIENRVNALGASEATVQLQGNDQILVQIPGLSDTQEALQAIGKTGKLEFARLDSFTDAAVKAKIKSGNYGTSSTNTDDYGDSLPSETGTQLKVPAGTYTPIITGSNITKVTVGKASDTSTYYAVNLTLDAAGTQAFAAASQDLVGSNGQIVIILDGYVQSAPAVQNVISDGKVQITGKYTQTKANELKTILESGSLPVSFTYSQSQTVGPTLGQNALQMGIVAAAVGMLLVLLYLLFFYRGLGLINIGAIAVFSVIYLGILATLSHFGLFSLSLAGIAGIVLTIGMAADSSVLTLERFREEIRMGRSVRAASITGVRHAIQTSIDADLVTLVSALALFFLATASVKGFGLTLALGIFCDIAMMLLFKAPLIRLMAPRTIAKHPKFWNIADCQAAAASFDDLAQIDGQSTQAVETGLMVNLEKSLEFAKRKAGEAGAAAVAAARKVRGRFIKKDIDFLGHRKIFLIISACLVVASCAVFAIKGLNFSIDFVGGTSITLENTGDVTSDQVRQAFEDEGVQDLSVQTTSTNGQSGYLVRTGTTSADEAAGTAAKAARDLGLSTESYEVSTIGPDWGQGVIQSSLIALLVSFVLIIIYIAVRFEYKMGVTAIIALLHDLIIVMGVYALVGWEISPDTIAALLTILGYSLYDTVVVFHRVNDNMAESDIKASFMTVANHSINQVFIRSINTTLASLIPVLCMLFFGGETLKDFAFAMAIGLIAGAYSSIGVASPIYAIWKTREPRFAKLAKKYGPYIGNFTFAQAPAKVTGSGASASRAASDGDGAPAFSSQASDEGRQDETPADDAPASAETSPGQAAAPPATKGKTEGKGAPRRPSSNHHYRKKK